MGTKFTKTKPADKRPKKPYKDYPLFFHASGRIAKKINGKLHYFGRWGRTENGRVVRVENLDAAIQAAVDLWNEQRDDLQAGRTPRKRAADGLTVESLVNDYLTAKRRLLDAGELTRTTFAEYTRAGKHVIEAFRWDRPVSDLVADDFGQLRSKLAETRGPVALGGEIQKVRMIFKWAYDEGLIEAPIRYGQSFNKPSAKVVRKARVQNGSRMFEADELRLILSALEGTEVDSKLPSEEDEPVKVTLPARIDLRATILLGINCAFGQSDVARLPKSAVDLAGAWVTFPRPKTGIDRKAKLWPETVDALKAAMALCPKAKDSKADQLALLTPKGKRWVRESSHEDPANWDYRTDVLGKNFSAVLKKLGINGRRGFYALRHSFQTAAEDCNDFPAIRLVMGHIDDSMSGVYRERISDERLEAVAKTVRGWLWPARNSSDGD